ncbi:MAG: hypothetical protein AAF658_13105 [Myxococcota bacterium]
MKLREIFANYAAFYREIYVPSLIAREVRHDDHRQHVAEPFDLCRPPPHELKALPAPYQRLLTEVGFGVIYFSQRVEPARFEILSPERSRKLIGEYQSPVSRAGLSPFMLEENEKFMSAARMSSPSVLVADSITGTWTEVESIERFFMLFFENAMDEEAFFSRM